MKRVHLFEFEDQPWFPDFLRNYGTDFLQFLSNKTRIYKAAVPIIIRTLKQNNTSTIIDLASGGGGGLLWISEEVKNEIPHLNIVLTDLYPNISAYKYTQSKASNFDYISSSVDARKVPRHIKGLRTMFLSLHHFKPADARLILQSAINSENPIAVFETQERSLASFIGMLLSPISVLVVTPFIRPFKWGRILFTYIIPVVPLFVLWDGLVSAFRTYSVKEMKELVNDLDNSDTFTWEINRVKSGPAVLLYLTGIKKH